MWKMQFWLDNIGQVLREVRSLKGLTQIQAAKLLGTSKEHLSKIEAGKIIIELDVLMELCKLYDVDPSNIFILAGVKIASKNSITNKEIVNFINKNIKTN